MVDGGHRDRKRGQRCRAIIVDRADHNAVVDTGIGIGRRTAQGSGSGVKTGPVGFVGYAETGGEGGGRSEAVDRVG
ncbi:MAG: hypothetical protein HY832_02530 [Candidatus Aenigmarchaeota archaeon]|nr:hypothetical protein [Candidatus Aenigmarchaeota archaeon]